MRENFIQHSQFLINYSYIYTGINWQIFEFLRQNIESSVHLNHPFWVILYILYVY